MTAFQALVLGAIQGITEFLPISSTAHLRVAPVLLGWEDPGAAWDAIIQLGTTAAVVAYFARDIGRVARAWLVGLARKQPFATFDARLGWFVIVGSVPVVVAGLALKHQIETSFRSLYVIALAAIGMALLLAASEWAARHARPLESAGWRDAIVVGLAQALALVPGSSRSGVTLTAGLFLGLRRDAAARFSFLLSIPATVGAGLFELRHLRHAAADSALSFAPLALGSLAAFGFGIGAIAFLLRLLRTHSTLGFVVYRLAFGGGLLLLLWRGVIAP